MISRALLALVLVLGACSGTEAESTSATTASSRDIWTPQPGTTWQWQLSGEIDSSYDVAMYDVDLFETPIETIALLQAEGRIVICYLSVGSVEDWRDDVAMFPDSIVGKPLEGWPGERWLDIRQIPLLAPALSRRLDLAVEKGCDGVEADNVDGHVNASGFRITAADQVEFNRWLADEAHRRRLSIGLKNDLTQATDLVEWFDWVLVEECVEFDECSGVAPFVAAGKAAFGAEYSEPTDRACGVAEELDISLLFKDLELGAATGICP
ncbi:MAG: endo alpha-1,4 polygalactosaminidase [Acidimicrobiia bacterium]